MNNTPAISNIRIPLLGEYLIIVSIIEGIEIDSADWTTMGPGAEDGSNSLHEDVVRRIAGTTDAMRDLLP